MGARVCTCPLCMHAHACMHTRAWAHMRMHTCAGVSIFVHVQVCVHGCVHVSLCVHTCMYAYVSMCAGVQVYPHVQRALSCFWTPTSWSLNGADWGSGPGYESTAVRSPGHQGAYAFTRGLGTTSWDERVRRPGNLLQTRQD